MLKLTPIAQNVEYCQAKAQLEETLVALNKIDTRLVEIEAALPGPADYGDDVALAAALNFAATGNVHGLGDSPASLQEEATLLRSQRGVLLKAIAVRREAFLAVGTRLSREVCAQAAALHQALATKLLDALLLADKVLQEEAALLKGIAQAGYEASFSQPLYWPVIGTLSEGDNSALNHRVRELRSYAH